MISNYIPPVLYHINSNRMCFPLYPSCMNRRRITIVYTLVHSTEPEWMGFVHTHNISDTWTEESQIKSINYLPKSKSTTRIRDGVTQLYPCTVFVFHSCYLGMFYVTSAIDTVLCNEMCVVGIGDGRSSSSLFLNLKILMFQFRRLFKCVGVDGWEDDAAMIDRTVENHVKW